MPGLSVSVRAFVPLVKVGVCPITELPADRNLITRKLGDFRTSMLQDALAGRSLELDALTGAVREIAHEVGEWASDAFEMRDAADRAGEDAPHV